jgi:hypothetical protein
VPPTPPGSSCWPDFIGPSILSTGICRPVIIEICALTKRQTSQVDVGRVTQYLQRVCTARSNKGQTHPPLAESLGEGWPGWTLFRPAEFKAAAIGDYGSSDDGSQLQGR